MPSTESKLFSRSRRCEDASSSSSPTVPLLGKSIARRQTYLSPRGNANAPTTQPPIARKTHQVEWWCAAITKYLRNAFCTAAVDTLSRPPSPTAISPPSSKCVCVCVWGLLSSAHLESGRFLLHPPALSSWHCVWSAFLSGVAIYCQWVVPGSKGSCTEQCGMGNKCPKEYLYLKCLALFQSRKMVRNSYHFGAWCSKISPHSSPFNPFA